MDSINVLIEALLGLCGKAEPGQKMTEFSRNFGDTFPENKPVPVAEAIILLAMELCQQTENLNPEVGKRVGLAVMEVVKRFGHTAEPTLIEICQIMLKQLGQADLISQSLRDRRLTDDEHFGVERLQAPCRHSAARQAR